MCVLQSVVCWYTGACALLRSGLWWHFRMASLVAETINRWRLMKPGCSWHYWYLLSMKKGHKVHNIVKWEIYKMLFGVQFSSAVLKLWKFMCMCFPFWVKLAWMQLVWKYLSSRDACCAFYQIKNNYFCLHIATLFLFWQEIVVWHLTDWKIIQCCDSSASSHPR